MGGRIEEVGGCLGLSHKLAIVQRQNFLGRAGEGMTFSLGYLSPKLNGFHLVEKWHSFLMVN